MQQPVDPVKQDLAKRLIPASPPESQSITSPGKRKEAGKPGGVSFKDILKERQQAREAQTLQSVLPQSSAEQTKGALLTGVEPLKFSAHAQARMKLRNINLSDEDIARLNQVVEKAQAKGAKESLILMNDLALVVSIKNRTVITAVDGANIKENIFTNIDSAVIV